MFGIELEKGMHSGIKIVSRFCKICYTRKLENEEHYLFVWISGFRIIDGNDDITLIGLGGATLFTNYIKKSI